VADLIHKSKPAANVGGGRRCWEVCDGIEELGQGLNGRVSDAETRKLNILPSKLEFVRI
jgi:hypothetical protein